MSRVPGARAPQAQRSWQPLSWLLNAGFLSPFRVVDRGESAVYSMSSARPPTHIVFYVYEIRHAAVWCCPCKFSDCQYQPQEGMWGDRTLPANRRRHAAKWRGSIC